MPTPFKQLLHTVVRIETKSQGGRVTGAGTSFVFRDRGGAGNDDLFLVSNKHLVEGAEEAYVYFATMGSDGRPLVGEPFYVKFSEFEMLWHGHPDPNVDISVMPLSFSLDTIRKGGSEAFLKPVNTEDVANSSVFEELDVTAPVLFVGFPNGMFDEANYLPIFRRGYVATSPERDFNSAPVFLVDASVFPGSSGSPVFTVGESLIGGTPSMKLLGVVASVYTQAAAGEIT